MNWADFGIGIITGFFLLFGSVTLLGVYAWKNPQTLQRLIMPVFKTFMRKTMAIGIPNGTNKRRPKAGTNSPGR